MNAPVTAAELREAFRYDPETGAFERKDSSRKRREHTGAINRRKDTAYHVLCISHRKVYAHRAAWMIVHGDIAHEAVIDHIDGNGLNNRLSNLRVVTKAINQRNRRDQRSGRLLGVVSHRGGFSVYVAHKYAGWTKDFFEACCIRKSGEVKAGYLVAGAIE